MRFTLDFSPQIAILWPLTKQRTFYTNGQGSFRISPLNWGSTVSTKHNLKDDLPDKQ